MKKFFAFLLAYILTNAVFAFEDSVVISREKLSDIRIEDHSIIDVFPLATIMNEKKILIIHPLKSGTTRFSALKGDKNIVLFTVNVKEDSTTVEGDEKYFDIHQIDNPPNYYEFELDAPPIGIT